MPRGKRTKTKPIDEDGGTKFGGDDTFKESFSKSLFESDECSAISQPQISRFFMQPSTSNMREDNRINDEPPEKILKLNHDNLVNELSHCEKNISSSTVQKLQTFKISEENECIFNMDIGTSPSYMQIKEPSSCIQEHISTQKTDNFETNGRNEKNDALRHSIHQDNNNLNSSKLPLKELKSAQKNTSAQGKLRYTPLELQVIELKQQYPDAILLIECGYKYRMFGEDAEIAAQVLNIGCFPDHNFLTASFPTHRLRVHVCRLVLKGYKVGVIKQTETAALKAAGDNKNTVFERKLHSLYTKSTLIGEEINSLSVESGNEEFETHSSVKSGYLICICENPVENKKKIVNVGIMCVQPATGDVMYSNFEDGPLRKELENIMAHIQPLEILIPDSLLSSETESLLKNVAKYSPKIDDHIRIERISNDIFSFTTSLDNVTKFYLTSTSETKNQPSKDSEEILSLPPSVICCTSALLNYLKDFKLLSLLRNPSAFKVLSLSSNFMKLSANTVSNLEIFRNNSDFKEHGSFFWLLNHTGTRFGSRLLRSWVSHPLTDLNSIEERQEIVTEIIHSESTVLAILKKLLFKLPDLEQGLCAALCLKCTCKDFYALVNGLYQIKQELEALKKKIALEIKAVVLKELLLDISQSLSDTEYFLKNLNEKAARESDKSSLFNDVTPFPSIVNLKQQIETVTLRLRSLLPAIAQQLHLPSFSYSTVSSQEYLIEVKNTNLSLVPSNWMRINNTKQVSRFRSPEVEKNLVILQQLREQMAQEYTKAWNSFLSEFNEHFYQYKSAISLLAKLDCYFCLADLGKQEGFCRPILHQTDQKKLIIKAGRHPVVEKLLSQERQYVSNDSDLNGTKHCMIITGPNMGGKSSYIRQVALTVIMAQIGSYVPAEYAELSIFDAVHTRMGAADDIQHKRSTFMVEMQETSEILHKATKNSLLVLDELGRGTSTHDGMAIAYSTLFHIITKLKCVTLFVTHYPPVTELQKLFPENISNNHMTFLISQEIENAASSLEPLTFLYQLGEGISDRSYGTNVAQLAGISSNLLKKAVEKSAKLEKNIQEIRDLWHKFFNIWNADLPSIKRSLYNLRYINKE